MTGRFFLAIGLAALTTFGLFWAMQALIREFELTVLAWGDIDLEQGNHLAGTHISRDDFQQVRPPHSYWWLGEILNWVDPSPWSVQRWAFLMRWADRIAPTYDAVLSTNGEMGLSTPVMQYIHYPYIGEAVQILGDASFKRYRPWRLISGFGFDKVRKKNEIVNCFYF